MAWMLKIYKTCKSTIRFLKYKFYNKLLGGVKLLRVTPGVTWTQPYIYIQNSEKIQLNSRIEVQFCAMCSKLFIFRESFIS